MEADTGLLQAWLIPRFSHVPRPVFLSSEFPLTREAHLSGLRSRMEVSCLPRALTILYLSCQQEWLLRMAVVSQVTYCQGHSLKKPEEG